MTSSHKNINSNQPDQAHAKDNNSDQTLSAHPQPHQPQTEGERQQQLQNAQLENQDAKVKLPEHGNSESEHTGIGSTDH